MCEVPIRQFCVVNWRRVFQVIIVIIIIVVAVLMNV